MRLHFGWWPMTWEEYCDSGFLALSPVTFHFCRFSWGEHDFDGSLIPASDIRSERWTGRHFEITHVLVRGFGRRWMWKL